MTVDGPGFVDVPFDGLEPERLVPTLPGLGLAMQPDAADGRPRARPGVTGAPAEGPGPAAGQASGSTQR